MTWAATRVELKTKHKPVYLATGTYIWKEESFMMVMVCLGCGMKYWERQITSSQTFAQKRWLSSGKETAKAASKRAIWNGSHEKVIKTIIIVWRLHIIQSGDWSSKSVPLHVVRPQVSPVQWDSSVPFPDREKTDTVTSMSGALTFLIENVVNSIGFLNFGVSLISSVSSICESFSRDKNLIII